MMKSTSIKGKLRRTVLLTSFFALSLMGIGYFIYEYLAFRQSTIDELSTLGRVIAQNSTAAVAFNDQDEAYEMLASLSAHSDIIGACIYNEDGQVFTHYPEGLAKEDFPERVEIKDFEIESSFVEGFEAIIQGDKYLGALFIRSSLEALYD